MPHDLATLALSGMTRLGTELRTANQNAASMEESATSIVRHLFEDLVDGETGQPACALVRAYLTMRFRDLDGDLQNFGRQAAGAQLEGDTRCMTLLATAGEKPEWNSRTLSRGHRTIPLLSAEMIERFPMISQLVGQLGIDVEMIVHPNTELILEAERNTYNVFYVEEAKGSPYIPAQDDFVVPHGIRSVIGFGGILPTGDMFAILLFAKVHVPRSIAEIFRNAAMNAKLALLPFCRGPILTTLTR